MLKDVAANGDVGKKKSFSHWSTVKTALTQASAGVKVTVVKAAGLHSRAPLAGNLKIRLECTDQEANTSKAQKLPEPAWQEEFMFIIHPNSAEQLTLTLRQGKLLRVPNYEDVGRVNISVRSIARDPKEYEKARWYPVQLLGSSGKVKQAVPSSPVQSNANSSEPAESVGSIEPIVDAAGNLVPQLQLQIFFSKDALQGPFSLLCCTWNVGNANPPEDLSSWIKVADSESRPHLVAVGVQECQGLSSRRTTTGSSRRAASPAMVTGTSVDELPTVEEQDIGGLQLLDATYDVTATSSERLAKLSEQQAQPQQGSSRRKGSAITQTRSIKMASSGAQGEVNFVKAKLTNLVNFVEKRRGLSPFEEQVTEALLEHYEPIARRSNMGGVILLVLARRDVAPFVRNVTTSGENTGVAGVGWNKGGVSVGLQLGHTDVCIVNSHLAAHQSKSQQRNKDYTEIAEHLKGNFGQGALVSNHHVVWMGDLNYRLDWGQQAVTYEESPTSEDWQSLVEAIDQGRFAELLATDQLRKEMAAQRAFMHFYEGDISFAPTFKVERGHSGTRYITKRSPAWCDRVLMRSNLPHKQASCIEYYSAPEVATSDHKPVAALIKLPAVQQRMTPSRSFQVALEVGSLVVEDQAMWNTLEGASKEGSRRKLKVVLLGPALSNKNPKPKHAVSMDAVWMRQGPLLGRRPEQLLQQDEQEQQQPQQHKQWWQPPSLMHALSAKKRQRQASSTWSMDLRHGSVNDLNDERLVLVVRTKGGLGQKSSIVARGVVPLHQLVLDHYATQPWSHVRVDMELHGQPLGTLSLIARAKEQAFANTFASFVRHAQESMVPSRTGSRAVSAPLELRPSHSLPMQKAQEEPHSAQSMPDGIAIGRRTPGHGMNGADSWS